MKPWHAILQCRYVWWVTIRHSHGEGSGACNKAKAAFIVMDFLQGEGQAQLQWVVAVRLESPQCGVDG